MYIIDLTLELADGMQTHPAHARCVVLEFSSLTRPVHMILLGQGILIMEHVAHLETLPSPRFLFVGAPLRIRGATDSPIRAMAIFEEEGVHA